MVAMDVVMVRIGNISKKIAKNNKRKLDLYQNETKNFSHLLCLVSWIL